jgi:hypothetical protein
VIKDIIIDEIAPDGLGFGEGSISGRSENNGINTEILEYASTEILRPDNYKTVEAYDSGCGDGRPVYSVWAKLKHKFGGSQHRLEADQSKLRPKLFGGDFATLYSILALASDMGVDAQTFKQMDNYVVSIMNNMGWVLGIHNDDHGDGENDLTGCGAIDNRPKILENAIKFSDEISAVAQSQFGISAGDINLTNIMFESRINNSDYFKGYSGSARQEHLEENVENVVRKVLTGDHQEAFVVINTRKGSTFDQETFRKNMRGNFVDEKLPQVFVVDIWQAETMIDKLAEKGYIREDRKSSAMAAVVVYTLATAATLTDGSLPVFLAK